MCCGLSGEDAEGDGIEGTPYGDADLIARLTTPAMMEIYGDGAIATRGAPALWDFSAMSMGLPSGRPRGGGPANWEGLLSDAAWLVNTMNPVSDINDAVTGSEDFSDGVLAGDWQKAVGGLAAVGGGLLGIFVPGHYSQYREGAGAIVREAGRVPGYVGRAFADDAGGVAGRVGTGRAGGLVDEGSSIVATSAGSAGDGLRRPGVGSGSEGVRPRGDVGQPRERPAVDPEGRKLTAPIILDASLSPDQIEFATLLLNDRLRFLPRDDLARRAGEEANGLHELATYADGSRRRSVFLADDLPPHAIPGTMSHEGIGHGIRSHVSPDRKFTIDDLTIGASTDDPDFRPLEQMMDAARSIKGYPHGTVAEPDEDFAYFIQKLTTDYVNTRAASPEATALLRRLWNDTPAARRSIQFYSLLAAGLSVPAALAVGDLPRGVADGDGGFPLAGRLLTTKAGRRRRFVRHRGGGDPPVRRWPQGRHGAPFA